MSKKEFLITVIVVVLSIALISTIIVLKKIDKTNPDKPVGTTSGVPHDHDGDGVPDHGDDAHENEANGDNTASASGGSSTSGGNTEAVVPGDSDIDISIGLEDLPTDGDGTAKGGSTGQGVSSGTGFGNENGNVG